MIAVVAAALAVVAAVADPVPQAVIGADGTVDCARRGPPLRADERLALGTVTQARLGAEPRLREALARAACHGDAAAAARLGEMLEEGNGLDRDEVSAAVWYRRAAEGGDAEGMIALGFMLEDGRGVARDDAQAMRWFRRAAETGHARGMAVLTGALSDGRFGPPDMAAAARWFLRALTQGHAPFARAVAAGLPGSDLDLRIAILQELKDRGLHDGPADGVIGPAERDAMGRWTPPR